MATGGPRLTCSNTGFVCGSGTVNVVHFFLLLVGMRNTFVGMGVVVALVP